MKYDWKFADRTDRPESFMNGMEIISDPTVKLLYRARKPEIDLEKLGEEVDVSGGPGGSFEMVQ